MKLNELKELYEMANIGPKTHRFGVDVKLNILQPGDKEIPHKPRVKIKKPGAETDFSIMLREDPTQMDRVGEYDGIISTKEYNHLLAQLKKYRIPFLNMWYDTDMDQDELRAEMDKIDAGEEVELRKKVK